MGEMAKFPYLTGRRGTSNLYYKRLVPLELRASGRPGQIWRSLKTSDRKKAEAAYGAKHAEVEALFAQWRQDDSQPVGSVKSEPRLKDSPQFVPLTPALLRRLADSHYLNVYENDFQWRGDLWKKVHEDEDAFWRGEIVKLPEDDWVEFRGKPYSYFANLMEEPALEDVFLYSIFRARKAKLQQLQKRYQLGDSCEFAPIVNALLHSKGIALGDADRTRFARKLMEVEIKALEDLSAGSEASFDRIVDRQSAVEDLTVTSTAPAADQLMSPLVDKYLDDTAREREWPSKTVLRKRGELREFLEIVGDKPINAYRKADGVTFKDVQLALPIYRQKSPFKGLTLVAASTKSRELRASGEHVDLLNPITINDKIGTVSLFFEWAKSRDSSVANPVADQRIQRSKNKRKGKKRHPWTIEELNRLVAAPIYTGCHSASHWKEQGNVVLRQSAMYWVPLIAIFSGMRLGEIIQMQVADVKCFDGVDYFDVTPLGFDPSDSEAAAAEDEKSLKTAASHRGIPIHRALFDLGFGELLKSRRAAGEKRLFPDYGRAQDDGSWSKQFSKHFKRFRESIGVTRRGVKFHSLRHNVEDALRNADVRKEVRDAIQGHGENGVSREYGSGYYLKTLNEAVQKIGYDGLKLPALTK
jgi:integrase